MPKTRKLVLTQGAADAFVQGSIRIGGRRLILIHDLQIKVALAGALADADEIEVSISSATQASMPSPNNNSVVFYRQVKQVGNPASLVDISWNVKNLPAFTVDDSIYFQFDTDSTEGANSVYITIYYDEKKVV